MSIEKHLGVGPPSRLLARADRCWPAWCADYRVLGVATDTTGLWEWLRVADKPAADEVLLALATLAAPDAGDDLAAAGVLARALVPGATVLANRLRTLTPDIDQMVAAQLWIEVRSFRWRRRRKVAANILADTRAGVLRECGVRSQVQRSDRTWARTNLVAPTSQFWAYHAAADQDAPADSARQLLQLLAWACDHDVISCDDRALLLCLVEAADRPPVTSGTRSGAGLMTERVTVPVARAWGLSAPTIRRRTRRSIDALSAAYRPGQVPA